MLPVVPISSFEVFKNTVNGNGYDMDGFYGDQCWDGLQLLWAQLGMFISTDNTHRVYGCWNAGVRNLNAGTKFDLVFNLADVKAGDVMIFNHNVGWWGDDGHGGYACEDYNNTGRIQLLSQNFRNSSATQGSPFSIDSVNTKGFLGAFRYKAWQTIVPPVSQIKKRRFPWVLYAQKFRQRK